ncbi:hypothetical protein BX666DRAFT_2027709 [Dichotomocladium elegans]|nr:hypothetical protein BX666DRAFT_2027709 [Dichotomocladium elegans]
MAYNNWSSRPEALRSNFRWFPLSQLIRYIQEVRNLVLRLPPQQPMVSGSIAEPPVTVCPVGQNQRFPENELFVCDALGDWGQKIDEFQLMCSILRSPTKLQRKYKNINTIGDVDYHVLVIASGLLKDAEQQHAVIDRTFFESRYCLQWEEKHQ